MHNLLLLSERELRKQDFIPFKKGTGRQYVMLFKELLEENFRHQKSVAAYASTMSISNRGLNVATSKIIGSSQKKNDQQARYPWSKAPFKSHKLLHKRNKFPFRF